MDNSITDNLIINISQDFPPVNSKWRKLSSDVKLSGYRHGEADGEAADRNGSGRRAARQDRTARKMKFRIKRAVETQRIGWMAPASLRQILMTQ